MSWQEEFPEFPGELGVEPPVGWSDASWHNDAAPFFLAPGGDLGLFVDHPDPALREVAGAARFVVVRMDGGQHVDEPALLATDDYAAVMALIAPARRAESWLDVGTALRDAAAAEQAARQDHAVAPDVAPGGLKM